MFKFIIVIILSVTPFEVLSKSRTVPFDTQHDLKQVIKNGEFVYLGKATFSILFWDLYKSKLSTTTGKYPIDNKKEQLIYEIHYLANISSDDLIKRTVEQWQHLNVPKIQYQEYLADLKRIWPDIEKGDKLALLLLEAKSVFYFNDAYIGVIDSPKFGQLFLDIWLSEETSQPLLRRDLLGNNYG
ncbi:chalcone isomerase family protein [Thalassotalea profundi]|uniref:Chalcone isomerase domain-containing protein n=1 Tax=Thalassotalea profundi TaxID=2036687 RepID=A0ABQ3IFP4_9GAMM|nr:chalcone isomerase family protein [Thalassotalea profundi]GHE81426.1 hypothetical protein GCM10011501_06990 [Thalassotalea profundi]